MTSRTATRGRAKPIPRRPDAGRRSPSASRGESLADGWRDLSWAMRVLRAFLGITFLFAGAQKLLDPNFLHPGSPAFVGTQLQAFARGTPAGPLLSLLDTTPVVAGIGIALLEIAIGLGTLLGVARMTAAFGGAAVSLTLWLSATWHVHPYFLGSDSIYAVAWLALLAGLWQTERARRGRVAGPLEVLDQMDRRQFLRGGAIAGLTLVVAAASKAFAGPLTSAVIGGGTRAQGVSGGGETGATGSGSAAGSSSVTGRTITTLDRLAVGEAIGFTAPGVGSAVLIRLARDNVVAYSRSCTHAGCLVGYDPSNRILFCPCHGAEFDPAHGAAPIAGPAPTALESIPVVVDAQTAEVILPAE